MTKTPTPKTYRTIDLEQFAEIHQAKRVRTAKRFVVIARRCVTVYTDQGQYVPFVEVEKQTDSLKVARKAAAFDTGSAIGIERLVLDVSTGEPVIVESRQTVSDPSVTEMAIADLEAAQTLWTAGFRPVWAQDVRIGDHFAYFAADPFLGNGYGNPMVARCIEHHVDDDGVLVNGMSVDECSEVWVR